MDIYYLDSKSKPIADCPPIPLNNEIINIDSATHPRNNYVCVLCVCRKHTAPPLVIAFFRLFKLDLKLARKITICRSHKQIIGITFAYFELNLNVKQQKLYSILKKIVILLFII